ncbi:hypothetical protein F5B20DRAFT_178654 [Whalleya microplaca]|nr:hypothetical protein F5B20DRAFT_178654 [Whalleya microplaca]
MPHIQRELTPWQKRWNREWLIDGVVPDLRERPKRLVYHNMRGHDILWTSEAIHHARVTNEAFISDLEDTLQLGIHVRDVRDRRPWQRAFKRITRPLRWLKDTYVDFRKWRDEQSKGEDPDYCTVVAVMEDQGENPKWNGELTLRIPPEEFAQMQDRGTWFEYPSPKNIKYFWVTDSDGLQRLAAPASNNWGPHHLQVRRIPFLQQEGRVIQNPRVTAECSPELYWSQEQYT